MAWMAWTTITTYFFGAIFIMLLTMTVLEIKYPSIVRKGFLPIDPTRGDRLFIGLLSSAFIHLAWLGVTDYALWPASLVAIVVSIVVIRWG